MHENEPWPIVRLKTTYSRTSAKSVKTILKVVKDGKTQKSKAYILDRMTYDQLLNLMHMYKCPIQRKDLESKNAVHQNIMKMSRFMEVTAITIHG